MSAAALGEEQPLSPGLRDWLARALQLDTRRAFASAPEALTALEEIVADDSMYVAAPVALETFLSRYIAALLELPTDIPQAPTATAYVPAPAAFELCYSLDVDRCNSAGGCCGGSVCGRLRNVADPGGSASASARSICSTCSRRLRAGTCARGHCC